MQFKGTVNIGCVNIMYKEGKIETETWVKITKLKINKNKSTDFNLFTVGGGNAHSLIAEYYMYTQLQ